MNKHPNPITAQQIPKRSTAHYTLWDGEQRVTVHMSIGAHGFLSAAVVTEYCDSPMTVHTYNGYNGDLPHKVRWTLMAEWVAEVLNTLATGTQLAVGTYCDIVETGAFGIEDMYV